MTIRIPACITHEVEVEKIDLLGLPVPLGRCVNCGAIFIDPQNLEADVQESIAIFDAACRGETFSEIH